MTRRELFKVFIMAPTVGAVMKMMPKPVTAFVPMPFLPNDVAPFITMMTRTITETEFGILRTYGVVERRYNE